jgi:hypothetical protein
MSGKFFLKALGGALSVLVVLVMILGIHIYMVTKPKADAKTVAMARIDIKQHIEEDDASAIEKWLSEQEGVQRVVLNRETNMIVFTFYPVKVSADQLAENLKYIFGIDATRYKPSAEQMASGCPAMSGTFTGKVFSFLKHKL